MDACGRSSKNSFHVYVPVATAVLQYTNRVSHSPIISSRPSTVQFVWIWYRPRGSRERGPRAQVRKVAPGPRVSASLGFSTMHFTHPLTHSLVFRDTSSLHAIHVDQLLPENVFIPGTCITGLFVCTSGLFLWQLGKEQPQGVWGSGVISDNAH